MTLPFHTCGCWPLLFSFWLVCDLLLLQLLHVLQLIVVNFVGDWFVVVVLLDLLLAALDLHLIGVFVLVIVILITLLLLLLLNLADLVSEEVEVARLHDLIELLLGEGE